MKKKYTPPKLVPLKDVTLQDGFVCLDGIKIGKYIEREGKAYFQIKDKSPHRSAERGTRLVEISIDDLGRVRFCREDMI